MLRRILSLAVLALVAALPAVAQTIVDANKTGSSAPFAGTFTWTGKPACDTALTGATARIIDVGLAPGMRVVCDGTAWRPDGPQILARGNTSVTTAADTNENALATVTVPAGAMGTNGGLLVYTSWTVTNSANAKTPRLRFGGTGGSVFFNPAVTTIAGIAGVHRIRNRGSANSQVGGASTSNTAGVGTSSSAAPTSSVDTSSGVDLVISGQKALGSESMSLDNYEVWLVP